MKRKNGRTLKQMKADGEVRETMKIEEYYSKKERRIILLGYLWRWGSIGLILLVPAITFKICEAMRVSPQTCYHIIFISAGASFVGVGIYDIVGAVRGFKHVLVSLQVASHFPIRSINPRRQWRRDEKKEYIGVGVAFLVFGLAIIILFVLAQLGVVEI